MTLLPFNTPVALKPPFQFPYINFRADAGLLLGALQGTPVYLQL